MRHIGGDAYCQEVKRQVASIPSAQFYDMPFAFLALLQWMAAWPEEYALDTLCVRMPTVGTNTQWQLHSTLHFGLPRHVAELSPVASSIDAL